MWGELGKVHTHTCLLLTPSVDLFQLQLAQEDKYDWFMKVLLGGCDVVDADWKSCVQVDDDTFVNRDHLERMLSFLDSNVFLFLFLFCFDSVT